MHFLQLFHLLLLWDLLCMVEGNWFPSSVKVTIFTFVYPCFVKLILSFLFNLSQGCSLCFGASLLNLEAVKRSFMRFAHEIAVFLFFSIIILPCTLLQSEASLHFILVLVYASETNASFWSLFGIKCYHLCPTSP